MKLWGCAASLVLPTGSLCPEGKWEAYAHPPGPVGAGQGPRGPGPARGPQRKASSQEQQKPTITAFNGDHPEITKISVKRSWAG